MGRSAETPSFETWLAPLSRQFCRCLVNFEARESTSDETTRQHAASQRTARFVMKSKLPRCWWPIGHLRGWLGPSGFGSKSTWRDVIDDLYPGSASGNCVLITGATAGIGLETLKAFCSTGATVVVGARDETRAKALACELMSETTSIVRVLRLDLSCSKSVHEFVDAFLALNLKLTVLVNNAGIMPCPFDARFTPRPRVSRELSQPLCFNAVAAGIVRSGGRARGQRHQRSLSLLLSGRYSFR